MSGNYHTLDIKRYYNACDGCVENRSDNSFKELVVNEGGANASVNIDMTPSVIFALLAALDQRPGKFHICFFMRGENRSI